MLIRRALSVFWDWLLLSAVFLFFDPKYSRIGGIGYLVLNALTVFGQIRQQPEGVAGTTNLVLDLLALGYWYLL